VNAAALPADELAEPAGAESAQQHLVTRVPALSQADTAADALARLREEHFEAADPVYLVDAEGRLSGIVPLVRIVGLEPAAVLQAFAEPAPPAVALGTDQEEVASHAIRHGLVSVPVVGRGGRLLGVVPPQALMEVLRREHVEDLHRFAGIHREQAIASRAIEEPPLRRVRHRLPWLLAGLAGCLLSAVVMRRFEAALEANIAIAFFIPAIVYLADAVGTQSESIAVRGLSLSQKAMGELVGGELRTGLLIGLALALVALLPTWLLVGDPRLAAAVALALLAASAVATVIGFTLPWLLARTGADPAFGSGPMATIVQDVLSLLIYFGTVSLLVL
jgi:magnesium transporter